MKGYSYWNDGHRSIKIHGQSSSHAEALSALNRHGCKPVDDMLSVELTRQKSASYPILVIAVKHLARQNLAFRGATRTKVRFSDPHQTDWLDQV